MPAQAFENRPIRADWAFSRRGSLKGHENGAFRQRVNKGAAIMRKYEENNNIKACKHFPGKHPKLNYEPEKSIIWDL